MNKFFLAIITFILLSHQSYAKTKITQSDGVVQSIEVLKQYITQEIPKKEKVCEIRRVPTKENSQSFTAENLIGALIGGAIGNQLGKGGGKQGTTAIGALIGSEAARSHKKAHAQNGNFEEKEICRIQKTLHTETIEKVSGYRLTIEIDGELISINSNRSYRPGEIISIRKEVNYSIYWFFDQYYLFPYINIYYTIDYQLNLIENY